MNKWSENSKIALLQKNITNIISNSKWFVLSQTKDLSQGTSELEIEKIATLSKKYENDCQIFTDDIISDYIELLVNIDSKMLNHTSSAQFLKRNFVITKHTNFDMILKILKQEAASNVP